MTSHADPPPPENSPPTYELPDDNRASSASATESQLEREMPTAIEAEHDPYAALRVRLYRFYILSYCVAVVGGQVQSAAIDWELYQRTRSAFMLGMLGAVQFLPIALLSLPAGQAADIFDRRRILIIGQLLLCLWGLGMAADSYWLGGSGHTHIFVAVALAILTCNSITLAFARPCRMAILPHIVPKKIFSNAVTWNSSLFEIACVVGPAFGGFLIRFGTPVAYLVNAGALLICFLLALPLPHVKVRTQQAANLRSLLAGVRFVFATDLLLSTMSLDLFAVLLGGATYLLPIFANDILHVGPTGYGWLRAAPAIGAVTMAMFCAHRPPMRHAGRNMLMAVGGFGLATLVFGLSRNYWLSLAMLFFTGAFDNISVVVRHTLVQLLTPDEMRGRVSAVNQVFIGSSNELGGLESGMTAAWLGATASVVFGGIGTLVVVAAACTKWPQLWKLGRMDDLKAATTD
jgi:MFS family permease